MSQKQKPRLRLMGKSLEDAIAFIEEMSGEKLTPEEIEEVRQALNGEKHRPLNSRSLALQEMRNPPKWVSHDNLRGFPSTALRPSW